MKISTRVDGQDCSDRSFRQQGTVACEGVASPAEAMMQASDVAGIMACRGVLGFRGRSRFRAPMSCDEQLRKAQREVPCL